MLLVYGRLVIGCKDVTNTLTSNCNFLNQFKPQVNGLMTDGRTDATFNFMDSMLLNSTENKDSSGCTKMACLRKTIGYSYIVLVLAYFIAVFVLAPWNYSGLTNFYANETAAFHLNSWWYEEMRFQSTSLTSQNFQLYKTYHTPPFIVVPSNRSTSTKVLGNSITSL